MTCNFEQGDKAIIVWEVLTGQMLRAFPMATTTVAGTRVTASSVMCFPAIERHEALHARPDNETGQLCACFFTATHQLLLAGSSRGDKSYTLSVTYVRYDGDFVRNLKDSYDGDFIHDTKY